MSRRLLLAVILLVLVVRSSAAFDPFREPVDQGSPHLIFVDGKFGFIDRNGNVVIPALYEFLGVFSGGLAIACDSSGCGHIDTQGRELGGRLRYDWAYYFSEGLAAVRKGSRVFFIDAAGRRAKVKFPSDTHSLEEIEFSEGITLFRKGARVGYIRRDGRLLTQKTFAAGERFQGGLAEVKPSSGHDALWGAIDKTGDLVIAPRYEAIRRRSEGLMAVMLPDYTWGFIDLMGRSVIAPQFALAMEFREGVAPVANSERRWGYIDRAGKWIIEPRLSWASTFTEGMALIEEQRGSETIMTVINRDWQRLFEVEGMNSGTAPWRDGMALFLGSTGTCYIDRTGQIIWPKEEGKRHCRVHPPPDERDARLPLPERK